MEPWEEELRYRMSLQRQKFDDEAGEYGPVAPRPEPVAEEQPENRSLQVAQYGEAAAPTIIKVAQISPAYHAMKGPLKAYLDWHQKTAEKVAQVDPESDVDPTEYDRDNIAKQVPGSGTAQKAFNALTAKTREKIDAQQEALRKQLVEEELKRRALTKLQRPQQEGRETPLYQYGD